MILKFPEFAINTESPEASTSTSGHQFNDEIGLL
jgi:hypothetical protein